MIRCKGEAGSGNVIEYARTLSLEVASCGGMILIMVLL